MELEEVLNISLRNADDEEKEKIYNFLVSSKAEDFPKKYLRKICEQSIEILKFKGRQRSSDLDSDRSESELLGNLKKRIKSLEDDKRVLKGKIKVLSEENSRFQKQGIGLESDRDSTDPLSELDRYEDLLKNISTKNKHIKKLLKDIESFQHKELQSSKKLKVLEDKLESSNMKLDDFKANFNLISSENKHLQKTVDELNADVSRLENNVKYLEKERDNAEEEFKEFVRKLEERAVVWRNIIVDKDRQLDSLQNKIRDFQSNTSLVRHLSNAEDDTKRSTELMEAIEERNAVIEKLESKIRELSTEMALSSELWNNMTSSKNPSPHKKTCVSCENIESALNKSLRRGRELSELLQKSEEDNFVKSKQAMDTLNALEAYQRGEDGLTSALDRITSLELKLQSREKQVKSLVSELNSLNEISQENTILRKKLNIPDDMIIATTNLKAKEKNKDKIISRLNLKLRASEEMRLQLKLEKIDLRKQISLLKTEDSIPPLHLQNSETSSQSSHRSQPKEEVHCENCLKSIHSCVPEKDDSSSKDLESRYSQISQENDDLRSGMFEILEKIQEFDEASDTIIIDSFILERLIQSLNVRTTHRFRSSDPGDLIGIKAREIALREKIDFIDKSVSSDKLEDIVDDSKENVVEQTPDQMIIALETLSEKNRNLQLEIDKLKIYELNFSELQQNLSQNESDLTKYCTTLVEKLTDIDVQFTAQSKKYNFLLEDFEKSEKDHKNSELQKISLIADLKRQINDLKTELSSRKSSKYSEHKESLEFRKLRENIQKQQLQITHILDLVFSGKVPEFKIPEISSEYGVIDEHCELGYITSKELESYKASIEKEGNASRNLKESLRNLETNLKISEEENSSLKSLLAEISDQHIDLRHLIADLQSTSDEKYLLTKSRQELSSAKIEILSLKSERQLLEETVKEMKSKISDAEQLLKLSKENKASEEDSDKIKLRFLEKSLFDLKTKFFKFTPLIFLTNFIYSYGKFVKKSKLESGNIELFLKTLNEKIEVIPDGESKDVVQLVKYKSKCEYLENQMVVLGKRLEALELEYQDQSIKMAEESQHWKTIEVLFGLEDTHQKTNVEQTENHSQTEARQTVNTGVNTDEIPETPTDPKRKPSIILSPIKRADKATSPPSSRPTSGKRSRKSSKEDQLLESEHLANMKANMAETENKLIESQARVKEMENTIGTLKTLLQASNEKQPDNKDGHVSEKSSSTLLETTINSFKTMLQEKESTLSHYQELLKTEKQDSSKIKSQLEKDHKTLTDMEKLLQSKTFEVQELTSRVQELATRKKSVEKREIAVGKDEEDDNGNEMSDEKIEEMFHTDVDEAPGDIAREEMQQIQKILKEKDEENVLLRKRVIILQSRCKDEPDVAQLKAIIDEKDMHINELMETLTNFHDDQQQYMEDTSTYSPNQFVHLETNLTRSETTNKILQTQIEALRRQVATLSVREKQARDLANSLKTQLIKRPVVSIKSAPSSADTTKSQKENLQRKVCQLEAELESSKDEVKKIQAVIEAKRAKSASEVNLWEKQKKWQQTAEKLKQKLEETEASLEKSRGLLNSARTTINRLEKDKHFLEVKLGKGGPSMMSMSKCCKTPSCPNLLKYCETPDSFTCTSECSSLARASSAKVMSTNNDLVETLKARNEFLQRRIMAMEASEGHGENILSQEIHKLHESFTTLEAENVRLEARNLHLQLEVDMKGQGTDCNDRLQKRIQHLEDYIIALKEEMGRMDAQRELKGCSNKNSSKNQPLQGADQTILVLKRVVEKLRAENKHLKEHTLASTSNSSPDVNRLQQMYADAQSTVTCLQEQLKSNDVLNELRATRDQLVKKTQLLEKAKILLTRAAAKEKVLKEQLTSLKRRCSELQNFPVIDEISE